MTMSRSRYSFASDNAAGVHPVVLEAMTAANEGPALAYGSDRETANARAAFNDLFGQEVESHFVFGGTGGNVLALAGLLRAGEAVLCTDTAHIHVDEAGAPERILGVQLVDVPHTDGKLTPADIENCVSDIGQVHHPRIGVVSITQVSEMGTVYSPSEVRMIADACHERGLRLHMDGARIANAVASLGGGRLTLRELTIGAGVDAITFGATKNGGMFGEAVIFLRQHDKQNIAYLRKQVTQLPSKMRFVSAQFNALLDDDLWLSIATGANAMAQGLFDQLGDISSLQLKRPIANSLFPTLSSDHADRLQRESFFWDWNKALNQYRWMTSWATRPEDVSHFADLVRSVVQ
jgi:threonine aldolase